MEGWRIGLTIWNVSHEPIVVTGFSAPDRNTKKEHFFLDLFDQRSVSGRPWITVGAGKEYPEWVLKRLYRQNDRLVIRPGDTTEFTPYIGWNFDVKQAARLNVLAGFQNQEKLCIFSTRPFVIHPQNDPDSDKLTFVD